MTVEKVMPWCLGVAAGLSSGLKRKGPLRELQIA
jgi:hypothetical protein